ncbi:MAG: WYL domain-containing protein [Lachnospiraceae bacterium]|nr:WYL domain-containing protein [Lachnospiraceae bacterium]
MPKSFNQKLKLLYILSELMEKTDEKHSLSSKDLINSLELNGISAERKSIYDDIECLRLFGFDIELRKEAPKGYYLASRKFEISELKLLVDSVQSSKFLTENKSKELIKKLESLASVYEATSLQRQVIVSNRIKTMNSSSYYNVDIIHEAISEDRVITFLYAEWNVKKELMVKKNGSRYKVSPFALNFNDDNYYLVGYDHISGSVKHYRVDKMKSIDIIDEPRQNKEMFKNFDNGIFAKKTFGMYGGEEKDLVLICDNKLAGVIIDRFGKDVYMRPIDDNVFKVAVKVNVSNQFFGWLCGIGEGIKITEPEDVVLSYKEHLKNIYSKY